MATETSSSLPSHQSWKAKFRQFSKEKAESWQTRGQDPVEFNVISLCSLGTKAASDRTKHLSLLSCQTIHQDHSVMNQGMFRHKGACFISIPVRKGLAPTGILNLPFTLWPNMGQQELSPYTPAHWDTISSNLFPILKLLLLSLSGNYSSWELPSFSPLTNQGTHLDPLFSCDLRKKNLVSSWVPGPINKATIYPKVCISSWYQLMQYYVSFPLAHVHSIYFC